MTRIAIVADTHVPTREPAIPDWVADEIRRADHTIHAGDFDSTESYDRVVDLADGNLTAVRGNVDPTTLDLPNTVTVDGVTFVVTHGTGSPAGWHDRVVDTARAETGPSTAPVAVAGHTHEVVDTTVDGDEQRSSDSRTASGDAVRVLSPGSATGASPADRATMLVVTVDGGRLDVDRRTERDGAT
ncbi:metallophosphoesterase family protein [Halosolutus amylolyticus]|uniref:Metallophosphoesterase family protein n=1 Tax=Halosolutus amylolyticus TaxID=2932267 RepID=A0ABD5PPV5_9EURY|nr:metallophosphoesterase family protein [Halosolutus amylolyticus]